MCEPESSTATEAAAATAPAPPAEMSQADVEEEWRKIVSRTAPFDPRFPNQNQTKHCYTSFLDYKRCIKLKGEDYEPCAYFQMVYKDICPFSWVNKWEEQIEKGTFAGRI